ncbi:hypothetical protein Syun_000888 [Stephania yunnanensis]|uniref:Uncharacterized protein n=1 Tax=Stephania yunnanensis TaxID=152371 RepID=A0AAP0LCR8_9MAGN
MNESVSTPNEMRKSSMNGNEMEDKRNERIRDIKHHHYHHSATYNSIRFKILNNLICNFSQNHPSNLIHKS